MTPLESMKVLLPPAEYDNIVQALTAAPASTVYGMWIARAAAALVVVKFDNEIVGYLLVHAADAGQAQEMARAIGPQLAERYAVARDAREAARLLIARIAR